MIDNSSVSGLKCSDIKDCSLDYIPCAIGKMHRSSFKSTISRKNKPAELVHFDLAGPLETQSLGGSRFLCLFVDDCSGMTFAYPLRLKSDAAYAIKWMITPASADNKTIISFRSDKAREFFTGDLNNYLLDNSIDHQRSAPYCPEQNGRIERQNRTIEEMIRTLMHSAELPKSLWAELARTSTHIRNLIPLDRLNFKTPYEIWNGCTPDVGHLRIIGSPAFAFIPDQFRKKLDPKGEECVLVGYEPDCKSYRL